VTPLAALDENGSSTAWPVSRLLWSAGFFATLSLVVLFFGEVDLPSFPLLIPMQMTGVMVLDGITAYLLLAQFRHWRMQSYAILAMAYLLGVFLAFPFLISFPGMTETGDPLLGGSQSSIWLWNAWHLGFPLLVGVSIILYRRSKVIVATEERIDLYAWLAVAATVLGVIALAAVAILGQNYLPVLIVHGSPHPLTGMFYLVSGIEGAINAVALSLCWPLARRGSLIHQWLFIALLAFMGETLASMLSDHRYTLGWYFSRFQGLIANGVIMTMLLAETSRIYGRLRGALEQARKDRARLWSDTKGLRISEERHRLLATGIRDHAVFMLDPTGRVVTWGVGAEALYGYSTPQINGRFIGLFFPSDDVAANKPESLLAQARAQGKSSDQGWRLRKDGKRIFVDTTISALKDSTGQLAGYGIIARDLSKEHHDDYRGLVQVVGS
jgi:PAS domain S-box-containing protein